MVREAPFIFKMSKLQLFQTLLTESLTVVANQVFGAVQKTIAEYEEEVDRTKEENHNLLEENARLQRLLDLVFKPDIKLHRADAHQIHGSPQQHCEQDNGKKMEQEDPEPLQVKEEQEELLTTPELIKTELIKTEPDVETYIAPEPSNDPSAVNDLEPAPVEMETVTDKPKQRTMAESVRSTLYKGPQLGELPDPAALQLSEVYKDFATAAPFITMDMSSELPLVDSAFGMVPAGSPLSYQLPLPTSGHVTCHPDAPPPPHLPLDNYRLESTNCSFVFSLQELQYLKSLETTWDMAHKVEEATREESSSLERDQLRRPRLTTRLRDICNVKGQSSAEQLADNILRGNITPHRVKRFRGVESAAVWEYCRAIHVNYSPCGFVIHPDVPWLGCSPYGLSYDPTESPPFGLLEIKFPKAKSYLDCAYVKLRGGRFKLHHQNAFYWQVQAQLLITGCEWCDFVVFAEDDMLIQRIYKDNGVVNVIREKVDHFFFNFYMPRFLNEETSSVVR